MSCLDQIFPCYILFLSDRGWVEGIPMDRTTSFGYLVGGPWGSNSKYVDERLYASWNSANHNWLAAISQIQGLLISTSSQIDTSIVPSRLKLICRSVLPGEILCTCISVELVCLNWQSGRSSSAPRLQPCRLVAYISYPIFSGATALKFSRVLKMGSLVFRHCDSVALRRTAFSNQIRASGLDPGHSVAEAK